MQSALLSFLSVDLLVEYLMFSLQTDIDDPIEEFVYRSINLKIERLFSVAYLILIRISVAGLVVPSILMSSINYFDFNLAGDSFLLPVPTMYVIHRKSEFYIKS